MTPQALPSSELRMRTVSDPARVREARRAIESFCLSAGLGQRGAEDVGLCVNEALANIIRHAYAGDPNRPIEIRARAIPGGVEVSLRDWGSGALPPQPPAQRDPSVPGGLGLICLQQCMSRTQFIPQPDGMLLIMTRYRSHADDPHSGPAPAEQP